MQLLLPGGVTTSYASIKGSAMMPVSLLSVPCGGGHNVSESRLDGERGLARCVRTSRTQVRASRKRETEVVLRAEGREGRQRHTRV